jgi:hypothetical protein
MGCGWYDGIEPAAEVEEDASGSGGLKPADEWAMETGAVAVAEAEVEVEVEAEAEASLLLAPRCRRERAAPVKAPNMLHSSASRLYPLSPRRNIAGRRGSNERACHESNLGRGSLTRRMTMELLRL